MYQGSFRTILSLSLILALLGSCSPASTAFPSLVGQGVLALSTTNAYQSPNLFLASELEKSTYLFQFMRTQGAPAAIEINRHGIGGLEMVMFYPKTQSAFIASLQEKDGVREWLVRGPFGIKRQDYRAIRAVLSSYQDQPVFEIHGRPFRFATTRSEPSSEVARRIEPEIPIIPKPTPTPTPEPKVSVEAAAPVTDPSRLNFDDPNFIPRNFNQEALMLTEGYAKKDLESGDIIHQVERDSETLLAVTTWYTGDEDNLKEIEDYNKRSEDHLLEPGDTILIPQKLIRRTKKMPLQPFRQ